MLTNPDPGYVETERLLMKLERDIGREYKKATLEVTEKWADYLRRFEIKDSKWREWVAAGKKTPVEYSNWRTGQILIGRRWENLKDVLATDCANAAKIARSITNGYMPEAYAINHNYATFEVERGSLADTSYVLYSRESVEKLWRENDLFWKQPREGSATAEAIRTGAQKAWDRRQIQSVVTQGILQGESIPKLTHRLERVTGGDHKAAIRNARTMMTGVQNAGRLDAYQRMQSKGISLKKTWIATIDGRTRHAHRQLDAVSVNIDEKFENEYGEIAFPGDPEADDRNVFNCRCALVSDQEGYEVDWTNMDLRNDRHLGDMTYEEWKAERRSVSNPITRPEEVAEAIRNSYIREYREL